MNKSFTGILSDYVLIHVKGEAGQSGSTLRSYYTAIDQYTEWYTRTHKTKPEAMDASSFAKDDVRAFLNHLEDDNGVSSFQYYLSMEKNHHFTGRKFKARDWMNKYFTQEDRAFVNADISAVPEIARLLRQIPEKYKHRALFFFLLYKYTDFDLDQPFQEQYERNNRELIVSLEAMIS